MTVQASMLGECCCSYLASRFLAWRCERSLFREAGLAKSNGRSARLNGELLVIDATYWAGFGSGTPEFARVMYPGASFALDRTMASTLRDAGSARAWDSLGFIERTNMIDTDIGWSSFIGAPIRIAYVDVIASFSATRFTQQQQFERIKFQIEHDSLTGLENRVQFRKAVRDEIQAQGTFAIAFVNIDGFRHVNEREGHQIADEVLVEVAAGLRSVANEDLVARMSADELASCCGAYRPWVRPWRR
jgi:hypothetical protein